MRLTNLRRKLVSPLSLAFACKNFRANRASPRCQGEIYREDDNMKRHIRGSRRVQVCLRIFRVALHVTACAYNATRKINRQISRARQSYPQLHGSRTSVTNGRTVLPCAGHTHVARFCARTCAGARTRARAIRYDLIRYTIADGAPSCLHDD